MSLHNMRTMKKKRMMIWKLNERTMYLFEETQVRGKQNSSRDEKKNFNSTKIKRKNFHSYGNFKKKFSNPAKIQIKNFHSYENFKKKFSNPAKIQIKNF